MVESTELDGPDAGAPPVAGRSRWFLAAGLTIAASAWLNAAIIWFSAPRFAAIFADFDTALPTVTLAFVGEMRWVIPTVLVAIGVLMIAKDFALAESNRRRINIFVGIGVGLVFFAYIFAMFVPLVGLIQSVSA